MKTTNKLLALVLMALAMVFASCSKDDDNNPAVPTQQEIESKIIGKWKLDTKEGVKYLTNQKGVMTFNGKHECTHSFSREANHLDGYIWRNKSTVRYQVNGNHINLNSDDNFENRQVTHVIKNITDDMFSYDERITTLKDGTTVIDKGLHIFKRVTTDYSQDIIGTWEGVSMTGDETYGDANARIEYRADGTYTYYVKDGDVWVPSIDADNEYNVDGDWLATRWRPEVGADYNYEWWDIDYIKDGIMKWSALREKDDGTRFTTTFTWKKVR